MHVQVTLIYIDQRFVLSLFSVVGLLEILALDNKLLSCDIRQDGAKGTGHIEDRPEKAKPR